MKTGAPITINQYAHRLAVGLYPHIRNQLIDLASKGKLDFDHLEQYLLAECPAIVRKVDHGASAAP